jgi:hypothetical protein
MNMLAMRGGFLAVALAAAGVATAQPFKCTNEEGKTVYSDQRCDTMPKKVEPPPVVKPAAGARYQPNAEDQERIKKLEAETIRKGSTNEQKEAAILEVSAIRSGQDSRLSPEERAKRDGFTGELGNADPKKRVQALRDLRNFYSGL